MTIMSFAILAQYMSCEIGMNLLIPCSHIKLTVTRDPPKNLSEQNYDLEYSAEIQKPIKTILGNLEKNRNDSMLKKCIIFVGWGGVCCI